MAERPDGEAGAAAAAPAERAVVVVPAHDEAASIVEVASRAARHAPVLVIDDGSADGTGELADGVAGCTVLRHATNRHIAESVRDGLRWALAQGFDYAVTMDAGLSHDPDFLPSLIACPHADLVLTYRRELRGVPVSRRALSALASLAVNAALRARDDRDRRRAYRDVTSGYRRYSRAAMEAVLAAPMAARMHAFHFEALAVVHHARLSISELPITYTFTNSSLSPAVVREAVAIGCRLLGGLHRPR